jgi:hypothetical protein
LLSATAAIAGHRFSVIGRAEQARPANRVSHGTVRPQ